MTKKQREKINKLMEGRYIPTLADSIRLYKMYEPDEYTSKTLSDIYRWLAQKPIQKSYKGGTVFLRAEAFNRDGDNLCVHYIYVNNKDDIFIEEKHNSVIVNPRKDTLTYFYNYEIKNYLKETFYKLDDDDDEYYYGLDSEADEYYYKIESEYNDEDDDDDDDYYHELDREDDDDDDDYDDYY